MRTGMRRIAVAGAVTAGLVTMLGPAAQAAAHHPVVIQEIFYNSPGSDRGSNASLNAEWVKLRNRTGHRISLANWTLRDLQSHVYQFGMYSLRAHGTVLIHTGSGSDTRQDLFQDRSSYVWNNNSDRATLKDAAGHVKSRCSYSDPGENSASVTC